MKSLLLALSLLALTFPALAADMANGHKINKSCALCHGIYGQGAPGKLSPRIAGLPKEYIIKAMKDYRDGIRKYPLMVRTSGLDKMTDVDMDDIATFLASMDLSSDKRFNVVSAGVWWLKARRLTSRNARAATRKMATESRRRRRRPWPVSTPLICSRQ